MMQNQYRVSKYNPKKRGVDGCYKNEEWTSYGDIGRSFGGIELQLKTYLETESAYASVIAAFTNALGITCFEVVDLEINSRAPKDVVELFKNKILCGPHILIGCRAILREECWAKLECKGVGCIHFGYDYYLYLSSEEPLPSDLTSEIHKLGLYIEPYQSPYFR